MAWDIDTLYIHFTERFKSQQRAQDKFEATAQRDAAKQNEFRKALDDLSQKMQTKRESTALQKSNDDRFLEYGKQISELRSRLDVGNPAIQTLQTQAATNSGIKQGSSDTWKIIVTIVSVGAIILGFIGFKG